jgi:dolichyl-diphosphooligosaccharide--protein glycosyltransferase
MQQRQRFFSPRCIIIAIFAFMALAFFLRVLPLQVIDYSAGTLLKYPDNFYNFRQIEVMVHNFPQYNWFDPMTAYPGGKIIDWGPMFTMIVAGFCILCHASTRPEILYYASFVPPIMAAATVPLVYGIGKMLFDSKTGLAAAFIISIAPFLYFYQDIFGIVDHHTAEAFFSTLFCLFYIYIIIRYRTVSLHSPDKTPVIHLAAVSAAAGVVYFLGLLTMPTMLIFAFIVAVFTFIQYIWGYWKKTGTDFLVVANLVIFGVVILLFSLYGVRHEGFSLTQYSPGHAFAYVLLMGATLFLYAISRFQDTRLFVVALVTAAIALFILLYQFDISMFLHAVDIFFAQQYTTTLTISENQGLGFMYAWQSFNYGIILVAAGFGFLIYAFFRQRRVEQLFFIVWSLTVLLAMVQHRRYEYYFAMNFAVITGLCILSLVRWGWGDLVWVLRYSRRPKTETPAPKDEGGKHTPDRTARKGKKSRKTPARASHLTLALAATVLGLAVTAAFVAISVTNDVSLGSPPQSLFLPDDWKDTLSWTAANTPDPGVDYYGAYDRGYSYPPESYGILAWWDYGHWITFMAKRIPNSNPFQDNLAGSSGVAGFFTATSEGEGANIAAKLKSKYVITDFSLVRGNFAAMALWSDPTRGTTPFQAVIYRQNNPPSSELVQQPIFTPDYYNTMIIRMHIFDGSMVTPEEVIYIEFRDQSYEGRTIPVIVKSQYVNATEGAAKIKSFNAAAPAGMHAILASIEVTKPLREVPALQHFRLVYESPQNASQYYQISSTNVQLQDMKSIKIFEIVPGATIHGTGTIEIPLETNTGRSFVYRQESVNGTFVVPYATGGGTPGGVRATGKYTIIETGRTYEVTDDDVREGRVVNGNG